MDKNKAKNTGRRIRLTFRPTKRKNNRIRIRPKVKRKQLLLKFSLYVCANVATKNDRLVLFGMDGAGVALARDNTKTSLGTSPF